MIPPKAPIQNNYTPANIGGIRPGKQVELINLNAGRNLRGRLLALGLIKGSMITVLANEGNGPLLIKVGESRLTIGRGMAERMQVR